MSEQNSVPVAACEACGGLGWIGGTPDDDGKVVIERCDLCNLVDTDKEAAEAALCMARMVPGLASQNRRLIDGAFDELKRAAYEVVAYNSIAGGDFVTTGPLWGVLAHMVQAEFDRHGDAPNYVGIEFELRGPSDDSENRHHFHAIVRKHDGKSPMEMHAELRTASLALRDAQRAYMADRGNEELGKAVGAAAAELDRVLGEGGGS